MFDIVGVVIEVIQKDCYKIIVNFRPYVSSLLYTLCMLDLIFNVTFSLMEAKENPFVKLSFSVMKYGFIAYIIENYKDVLITIVGGGIQLGNIALGKGNATYFTTDLFDFMYSYIQTATTIFLGATGVGWGIDLLFVESLPMVVMIFLGGLLIFIFWTIVHFIVQIAKVFLVCALAYPLIPFTVFTKTRDIGYKAISSVISSAIFMFVIVTLLNMTDNIRTRIDSYFPVPTKAESMAESFKFFLVTILITFILFLLIKNADSIASMIISGTIGALSGTGNNMGIYGSSSNTRGTITNINKSKDGERSGNSLGFSNIRNLGKRIGL